MADDTTLNPGAGGDVTRSIDKAGVKTTVVTLDVGGAGAETLLAGTVPVSGTVAITSATLATVAKQDTGNTSLAAIDGKITAVNTGAVTVVSAPTTAVTSATFATAAKQDTLLAELQLKADLTETQPVSAATLPLPSGAATSAKQDTLLTELQLKADLTETQPVSLAVLPALVAGSAVIGHVIVDSAPTTAVTGPLTDAQLRATPVPVSGTVSTGLTQPLTDVQLRAAPVPISAASLPLPTGATTAANQATEIASLASAVASLASLVSGLLLAQEASGTSTTGPMMQAVADDVPPLRLPGFVYPLSLAGDGRLRVSVAPSLSDVDVFDDLEAPYPTGQSPWALTTTKFC